METQDDRATGKLIRTSVLLTADIDKALRGLADAADRPLSREIRRALEDYVERESAKEAA